MSTEYGLYRAVVATADQSTGAATVRIPALLGSEKTVPISTKGLIGINGSYPIPAVGSTVYVTVSQDGSQYYWLTGVPQVDPASGAYVTLTGAQTIAGAKTLSDLLTANAGVSTTSLTASGTVSASGDVTGANLVTGGAVTATGDVSGSSITSTGTVSGSSITSTGAVSGSSVTATGAVSGSSVTATGTVSGSSVTATGTVSGATLSASTSVDTPLLTVTGNATFDTDVLVVDSVNNRVGILDANPAYTFDVTGVMRVRDNVSTPIIASGTAAGIAFEERDDVGDQWIWYAAGSQARLYNGSDYIVVNDVTGNTSFTGSLNVSGSVGVVGAADFSSTVSASAGNLTVDTSTLPDQQVLVSNNGGNATWQHMGVPTFTTTTTRDSAISSPTDGMAAYTQDGNVLWIHNGTSWVEVIDTDVFKQYITATSSGRPTATEGRMIWETDTNRLMVYDGSAWTPARNTAWGVDPSLTTGAGFYSCSSTTATWNESVTLRSGRKFLIDFCITSGPSDTVGSGGTGTNMQLTITYNGVEQCRPRQFIADATDIYFTMNWSGSFIVTGTGSAANVSFSLADALNRQYDSDVLGSATYNYSFFTVTDIGPST